MSARIPRRLRVAAASVLLSASAWPATVAAEPTDAEVVAVWPKDGCAADPCGPGDEPVAEDTIVAGTLQIRVRARALIPLERVQLQAQFDDDPRWYCIQQWNGQGRTEIEVDETWNSARWTKPGPTWNCDHRALHFHGQPTRNGTYRLRVLADEIAEGGATDSRKEGEPFQVRLSNPPQRPAWASDPAVSGARGGRPRVTLRWSPNPEDQVMVRDENGTQLYDALGDPIGDVVEYHFVRVSPDGTQSEFAVSAIDPTRQGCQRVGRSFYQCTDRDFSARGYGGSYRYAVIAYRPGASGAGRCSLRRVRCVQSELSAVRAVTLAEAAGLPPPPVAEIEPGPAAGPEPGGSPTGAADPVPVAPEPERSEQFAAAPADEGDGGPPLAPVAAAMLAVVGAWHATRIRRIRRQAPFPQSNPPA